MPATTVLGARDILSKMSKNPCFLKKDFIEKQKQTKQTRTRTKSQKWRSHGGLSVGRRRGENGGKCTENKNNL